MDFTTIIIIPTIFYFTYKFLESLVRRKERMMLIEKLDLSNLQALPAISPLNVLDHMPNKRFSNLRTGLLFAGIGLGLFISWILSMIVYSDLESYVKESWRFMEMFYVIFLATPVLFGGIGLLISFLIEQKARKQE